MDIPVTSAYLSYMFARLVTMLAVLAVAVMTTVTFAHAARMSTEQDHAAHVGEMMHDTASSEHSCDRDHHCGSVDAGSCELLCAGLSVVVTSSEGTEQGYLPASHDLPSDAIDTSRAPGLNERPPKLRLL
ncbi:hypothetical protein HYQ43_13435 [Paracoccus pantotrophus]|uniref:CopL family metal-binding regulatory protein n=2 Tax=Paracoccus TaxID=265 RepID=A0A7H9BVR6_PARPN|nr:hypothetical protein [Paracoccus pantotrophus]QLH15222.1 hypothetical protein HYQ43_13435 [Paracoccus pantotrophus]RNI16224.1 hypothetical protein EB844_14990 [Paracoccus pantotrophus]